MAATADGYEEIIFAVGLRGVVGLLNDHPQHFAYEVLLDGFLLTVITPVPGLSHTRAVASLRRPVA